MTPCFKFSPHRKAVRSWYPQRRTGAAGLCLFLICVWSIFGGLPAYGEEKNAVDRVRELAEQNRTLLEESKAYENKMLEYITQLTVKEKQLADLGKKLGSAMGELQTYQGLEISQKEEILRLRQAQEQMAGQSLEIERLKSEMQALSTETETLHKIREEYQGAQDFMKKREDEWQAEKERIEQEKEVLSVEKLSSASKMLWLEEQMGTLRKESERLRLAVEEAQKSSGQWVVEKQKATTEVEGLKAAKLEVEEKLIKMTADMASLRKEKEELEKTTAESLQREKALNNEKKSLETELETLRTIQRESAEKPFSQEPEKGPRLFEMDEGGDSGGRPGDGAELEDPELAAAAKTLRQIQADLAGSKAPAAEKNTAHVPVPLEKSPAVSEFLLDKSVVRPRRERLAAWQAPGLQELESENLSKDRKIETLREDLTEVMQKLKEENQNLTQELQQEREKAQDAVIHSKTKENQKSREPKKSEVKSERLGKGTKLEKKLQKEIHGLRQDARQERADYYYNLGVILLREGRFKKAAYVLEKAVHINPLDTSAHYNLGILYDDHLAEPMKAIRHYEAFLKLSHHKAQVRDVAKWLKLTQDYYGSDGRKGRVDSMRQAVEELFFTAPY